MQEQASHMSTDLEKRAALSISTKASRWRNTNIMVTIAPSTKDSKTMERLLLSGLTVARLNLSFSTLKWHEEAIQLIRETEMNLTDRLGIRQRVGIAVDLRGPEIRTGALIGNIDIVLKKGETITLTKDKAFQTNGDCKKVYISYDNIVNVLRPDDRIYINDGTIPLTVTGIIESNLMCSVNADGILRSGARVLMVKPNDLPSISDMDRENIAFAITHQIDYILMSFVRHADDVLAVRACLGRNNIRIIAKFESIDSIRNMDSIIDVADGCYISRHMLSVVVPVEKMFLIQKNIIAKCNAKGKLVMTTKEMLPELILPSGQPPSSDFSDIANAVLDGVDILHVPDTSDANFLVSSVQLVSRVCRAAETAVFSQSRLRDLSNYVTINDKRHVIAFSATKLAMNVQAAAIIVASETGGTVIALSKYRPDVPIISVTFDGRLAYQLIFNRAVRSFYIPVPDDENLSWQDYVEERLKYGVLQGKIYGIARSGDPVIYLYRSTFNRLPDSLRVEYLSDIVTTLNY